MCGRSYPIPRADCRTTRSSGSSMHLARRSRGSTWRASLAAYSATCTFRAAISRSVWSAAKSPDATPRSSLAGVSFLQAQIHPNRPIRMIVGFPPGGVVDAAARIVGDKLGDLLGQPVVIENRPGASGTLAAGMVVKAAPDGHTLFLCPGDLITLAALKPHMDFDPGAQLRPIAMISSNPLVVVANAKAPFK